MRALFCLTSRKLEVILWIPSSVTSGVFVSALLAVRKLLYRSLHGFSHENFKENRVQGVGRFHPHSRRGLQSSSFQQRLRLSGCGPLKKVLLAFSSVAPPLALRNTRKDIGVIERPVRDQDERKAKRARRRKKNRLEKEAEQGGAFVPAAVNVDARVPVDEEGEG